MTTLRTFTLDDPAATMALGARLARILRAGDVIALEGDLGAGKTTLARGLIQALQSIRDKILAVATLHPIQDNQASQDHF